MNKDEMFSILKLFSSGLKKIGAFAGKLLKGLGYGILFIIAGTASTLLRLKYKKETSKA